MVRFEVRVYSSFACIPYFLSPPTSIRFPVAPQRDAEAIIFLFLQIEHLFILYAQRSACCAQCAVTHTNVACMCAVCCVCVCVYILISFVLGLAGFLLRSFYYFYLSCLMQKCFLTNNKHRTQAAPAPASVGNGTAEHWKMSTHRKLWSTSASSPSPSSQQRSYRRLKSARRMPSEKNYAHAASPSQIKYDFRLLLPQNFQRNDYIMCDAVTWHMNLVVNEGNGCADGHVRASGTKSNFSKWSMIMCEPKPPTKKKRKIRKWETEYGTGWLTG